MDIDNNWVSSNWKVWMKIAFSKCSPSEFLKDEELFASFVHCIGRGTPEEINQLQKAVATSLSNPTSPTPPRVVSDNTVTTQPASSAIVTQQLPTSDTILRWQPVLSPQPKPEVTLPPPEHWSNRAKAHLELVVQKNKAKAILQVVNGLRAPLEKPNSNEFWLAQDGILKAFHGFHQFTRLSKYLQEARNRNANAKYQERLFSLYYAHAIDELVRSSEILGRQRQGVGRLTLAFERVAAITETTVAEVGIEYRAGEKYKRLVANGGSGSIFQLNIDDDPNWNFNIKLPDVELICKVRDTFRPRLKEESLRRNKDSRLIISQGLLACGCIFENTDLKQILDKEEEQERTMASSVDDRCPSKRFREIEAEESVSPQEFDDNQSGPLSKRQRQNSLLYCDSNQGSYSTDSVLDVSVGMSNHTAHSHEVNNDVLVLREVSNIDVDGNTTDSKVLDKDKAFEGPSEEDDMSDEEDNMTDEEDNMSDEESFFNLNIYGMNI